ncbi:MAG: DUF1080 domain-containing protein [Calditrichaeota bacterium]|nr:MAG: DUF1080 domain-containing protein [Calditrichota bacterium]
MRDHFPAIVVGDKLYCIGGRNTSVHTEENFTAFFNAVIPQVDVFDFKEGQWRTAKQPLPVPTAAGGLTAVGNYILYFGGESGLKHAHDETQCFDVRKESWQQLAPLVRGRHGSQAINYNDKIYFAAGSPVKGGGNISSLEVFSAQHDWQSLFNGNDLDGWQVKCLPKDEQKDFWSVQNGAIVGNSMGSSSHDYVWLQSEKEYSDFEIRLKFQADTVAMGNSGLQIRSRYFSDESAPGGGWLDGPQVDIHPPGPWRTGLIYDETRDERRWINPSLADWKIDKEKFQPKRVVFYYAHENHNWNDLRVVCKGTKIRTYLNGNLVSDYDGSGVLDNTNHQKYDVGLKGHLALQIHAKDQVLIRFKDIEIRKL